MPRPRSELTNVKPRALSARLTEDQILMFKRLGGSKWLRDVLENEYRRFVRDTINQRRKMNG